ncbi:hypothetical protein RO3G_05102 [Rhizopus delemar RA 99-880]|uniref:Uncharacterized protein n=1 Tax=Rhizopus delemar (strain RA 99-880 / ATCC MYA-4621 / FGSC 9543 / NRRL 43880) TaxID=246409 RepID=I1BW17_RHIO9|nr:hypothetical protein RO3G_05102 [Rhizopus delemar RA 99-880]|eukprot:EIE80397.1 hypothetical protein RO3G_05102 [Rhizopus delemar RA 99-880]
MSPVFNYRVNLIDKETLQGGVYDEYVTWRARLFLFLVSQQIKKKKRGIYDDGGWNIGFCVTKYVYEEGIDLPNMYLGIADVVQCVLIMLR